MRTLARFVLLLGCAWSSSAAEPELRRLTFSTDASHAALRVHAERPSAHPIPRFITGKFAEHLGFNIYGGMDAQILRNPTFADYPFWTGSMNPDGVTKFHVEDDRIAQELKRLARRFGAPDSAMDNLVGARTDGLAAFWLRTGSHHGVVVSPDAGPHGRAQRVDVKSSGQGIAQWTYLPLHRVRTFEVELVLRSPDLEEITVAFSKDDTKSLASAVIRGVGRDWRRLTSTLTLSADAAADVSYLLSLVTSKPGQFVISHIFIRPADHIHCADPDVVKYLRDSRLPLLRWPGGNFVSTYHWEEGIGPIADRPTRPNYAWGGIELNTFGTDEFIALCRSIGCEPMICINGGGGTPAEAAAWIEYCNGAPATRMGARRAANGHPEPYHVKHWEVGNELWGRWQMGWTTASGYVDRFKEFSRAMRAADPKVHLYACGAPVMWGKGWNDTLIAGAARELGSTTDHPLIGGAVSRAVDPLDVFRDFMAVPEVLGRKWSALENDMRRAGVRDPHLAVTELQMFAHLANESAPDAARLTRDNLVNPGTLAEALYDVLLYHAAIRLGGFVELITHSATVNHGGGLRKERERVWANPCHYAQGAFSAFAGATPVPIDLETSAEHAPLVLPELKSVSHGETFGALDALAALASNGDLLVSLVHRGSTPTKASISFDQFAPAVTAEVWAIAGDVPWAVNTLENPGAIIPHDSVSPINSGTLVLDLQPFSVCRLRIPKK